jgi:precorrin-6A/cobalt-precorrin-6A reductase
MSIGFILGRQVRRICGMPDMILLLGGTSDSIEVAGLLLNEGLPVIFSMATEATMGLPESPLIVIRRGPLDQKGMEESISKGNINVIIDATHPYAVEVTRNALSVCGKTGVRYFRLTRKKVVKKHPNIIFAENHEDAARKTVSLGGTILAAIGIRNLSTYVSVCHENGPRLIVRALPNKDSIKILEGLGIPEENWIIGQGPFSYDDNVTAIKQFDIRTLVTKDSGTRGGTEEKIQAALDQGCKIVVVQRPSIDDTCSFSEPLELVNAVKDYLITMSSKREGVASRTSL